MKMKHLNSCKEQVAMYMVRLYQRFLTTASGGNISMLVDSETIVITPSQMDKGMLTAENIAVIGLDEINHTPDIKMTMETFMHISLYKERPDIKAIVHAHPPTATAFAASNVDIDISLTGEPIAICGMPVRAEYATMGSRELAANAASVAKDTNTIILNNHGVITMGKTIFDAYDRIEVLENAAKMTLYSKMIGQATHVPDSDIDFLIQYSKQ
jgi:L-fuculose-phosphate aldolase